VHQQQQGLYSAISLPPANALTQQPEHRQAPSFSSQEAVFHHSEPRQVEVVDASDFSQSESEAGTPAPDTNNALWSGFQAQAESSFINPWSAPPRPAMPNQTNSYSSESSDFDRSPGGRRGSFASSLSSRQHFSNFGSGIPERRSSAAYSRRASLAASVKEKYVMISSVPLPSPEETAFALNPSLAAYAFPTATSMKNPSPPRTLSPPRNTSPESVKIEKEKKKKRQRTTAIIDGTLTSQSYPQSRLNQRRKSSLKTGRAADMTRKSSLSVSFVPSNVKDDQVQSCNSSIMESDSTLSPDSESSYSAISESDDTAEEEELPLPQFTVQLQPEVDFFTLRNPWTGYTMSNSASASPQLAGNESRRGTLMPQTPSNKGSISSIGILDPSYGSGKARGVGLQNRGTGFRVSLDVGAGGSTYEAH